MIILGGLLFTACSAEVIVDEVYVTPEPIITLHQVLGDYELWYVDIERTEGNAEIPFLQKAFTLSFNNSTLFGNNNLSGIGANGDGFGIDFGSYTTFGSELRVNHDQDGVYLLEVDQLGANEIRIYDPVSNTSYYLQGHQRDDFDYDQLFYDNIRFLLQEYDAWEKVYTSEFGVLNEFDEENYLKFLPFGAGDNFRSSKDINGTRINELLYDYTGHYEINDIINSNEKTLTLDYTYLDNELFELRVINDSEIELFHTSSGTVYRFKGRGYIQFKNGKQTEKSQKLTKRIKKADFMKRSQ